MLRGLVTRVLEAIPPDGALNDYQRQRLRGAGAQLDAVKDGLIPDPTLVVKNSDQLVTPITAVTKLMTASLRGGESLVTIGSRLAATERKLRPAMPDGQVQIESRCPAELLNQLADPPAFPLPAAWLPVAGAVVGALGGLNGVIGVIGARLPGPA